MTMLIVCKYNVCVYTSLPKIHLPEKLYTCVCGCVYNFPVFYMILAIDIVHLVTKHVLSLCQGDKSDTVLAIHNNIVLIIV